MLANDAVALLDEAGMSNRAFEILEESRFRAEVVETYRIPWGPKGILRK